MSFDEEIERTLDLLTDRLRDDVARHVRSAAGELAAVLRAEREAMEPPPAEPPPAPVESLPPSATTDPGTGRLAESIRAINDARSLSEILDTLVSRASLETSRVAVVLVRGDRFEGWRLRGFDAAIADSVPLDIASADAGIILQVAQTAMSAHSGDGPAFAQLPSGDPCLALPLVIGGQVVAVLYADTGQGAGDDAPADADPINVDALEVLALYASRCLEAVTAIKAARTLVAPLAAPPRKAADDDYVAARRYARLLVSEIKLYHADQVEAGRRERDLTNRLGGEIAHARALYDERVPQHVRQRTDYVREELIRTLAEGDATLLEAKARA